MGPQVCTASDGLIDPDAFVASASDLDTEQIRTAASSIRAMGTAAAEATEGVASAWQGLSGCYQAPEQEQVYALMDPAVTSANALATAFGSAAGHLQTYADDLEGHRARLAAVERDARAFRTAVIDGVLVDASSSTQAGFGDYLAGAFDWVPGVDERKVTVPWYQDGPSVDKNKDLLARYAAVLADISATATTCANAIQGLLTRSCMPPAVAVPAEALTGAAGAPLPWGEPREEGRNCPESVGHGGYQFGTGLLQGVGMLTLGYNPANGDWFTATAYGQSWGGLADLVGSLVLTSPIMPTSWVAGAMYLTGDTNNEYSKFMGDRVHTVAGLSSLVGYDIDAKDGWHAWREDGVAAGTEAVLNIGTFFIPGAGEASGALKGASLAAKASRIAELSADVLVQGGSWAVRGGIRLTDTLLDALRLGDRALPLADDLATTTAKTVTLKPATLIDLLDDPLTTGSRHTPASDQLGLGPAHADTATAPSADNAPDAHAPDSAQSPPHDANSHPPVDDRTAAHHPDGDPGTHAPLDPSHPVDSSADWTGESGLHLDGEQVKVVDDYHAAAARAEPAITKALQQVEAQTNADLATTRTSTHPGTVKLVGLDARLKTSESLYRKIATDLEGLDGPTADSTLAQTGDVIRYTYSVPEREFGVAVRAAVQRIEDSGFRPVKWKNTFGVPDVYQGINSVWTTPGGQLFEIQFHTPASFYAKTASHEIYEQLRLPSQDPQARVLLLKESARIFNSVPLPADASAITTPDLHRAARNIAQ